MSGRGENKLGGHLWISGQTKEDSLEKTERALGQEWFAVTAFPLLAGTFGPIASALNVCALVRPWRCELTPNGLDVGNDVADPIWLIVINALSLFFGVAANLSILLMVEDGDGYLAFLAKYNLQLITGTIIGGGCASIILIALVITAILELRLPNLAFTEAFYYAIMSAALYFFTSTFLIYTAHMLWGSRHSKERVSQVQFVHGHHRLMRLTVLFMAYILLGAAVFSHVEGWRYLDAVFWADVTILTIGFGDFKPSTNLGRALLFPYATCGVFILFLVVYCIPKLISGKGESMWEIYLRDQGRLKKVQQRSEREQTRTATYINCLSGKATDEEKDSVPSADSVQANGASECQLKQANEKEEREVRRRDFDLMQDLLQKSARKRLWYSVALSGLCLLFLWLVGAASFFGFERTHGWTYFDAVYFAFTAILVIGYGDITPSSNPGRAFFVLWSLIVVPTLTMLISSAVEAVGHPYLIAQKAWFITLKEWFNRGSPRKILPKQEETLYEGNLSIQQLPHNVHDKNHLIVKAIKSVIVDHIHHRQSKERPDYSFEEWEYILYLLGALEPLAGEGKRSTTTDNAQSRTNNSNIEETGVGKRMVDWLHGKNPLNSTEILTEWILLTLVEKLEGELLNLRRDMGNTLVD